MMNKEEIENRIKFLEDQIPDKKLIIEKIIREFESICHEILDLKEKLLNGK